MSRRRWRCCSLALAAAPGLLAQSVGPNDVELRGEAQNPIANLISVPFQNNSNFPVEKVRPRTGRIECPAGDPVPDTRGDKVFRQLQHG